MIAALAAAVVLGFPAWATWAARTGGRRRLWRAAGLTLVAIGLLAAATLVVFGRRPPDRGLVAALAAVLMVAEVSFGLPVVVGAAAIDLVRRRVRAGWALYLIAAALALLTFVVATLFAVSVVARLVVEAGGVTPTS